jgi:hypothetical protein
MSTPFSGRGSSPAANASLPQTGRNVNPLSIRKYDPDQPRDEDGRWTDGGGLDSLRAEFPRSEYDIDSLASDVRDRVAGILGRMQREFPALDAIGIDMNEDRRSAQASASGRSTISLNPHWWVGPGAKYLDSRAGRTAIGGLEATIVHEVGHLMAARISQAYNSSSLYGGDRQHPQGYLPWDWRTAAPDYGLYSRYTYAHERGDNASSYGGTVRTSGMGKEENFAEWFSIAFTPGNPRYDDPHASNMREVLEQAGWYRPADSTKIAWLPTAELAALRRFALKYSPDQPRDQAGRWATGGFNEVAVGAELKAGNVHVDFSGIELVQRPEIAAALQKFHDNFPKVVLVVKVEEPSTGFGAAQAETQGYMVKLSPEWFGGGGTDRFRDAEEADRAAHWSAVPTPVGVLWHELGHVADWMTYWKGADDLAKTPRSSVESGSGRREPRERFAEGFSQLYTLPRDEWTPDAHAVAAWLPGSSSGFVGTVVKFDPDQPRDDAGRWSSDGGPVEPATGRTSPVTQVGFRSSRYVYHATDHLYEIVQGRGREPGIHPTSSGRNGEPASWWSAGGHWAEGRSLPLLRTARTATFTRTGGKNYTTSEHVPLDRIEYWGADGHWHPAADLPPRYAAKYSPEEPRDEAGRWTTGSGGGAMTPAQAAFATLPKTPLSSASAQKWFAAHAELYKSDPEFRKLVAASSAYVQGGYAPLRGAAVYAMTGVMPPPDGMNKEAWEGYLKGEAWRNDNIGMKEEYWPHGERYGPWNPAPSFPIAPDITDYAKADGAGPYHDQEETVSYKDAGIALNNAIANSDQVDGTLYRGISLRESGYELGPDGNIMVGVTEQQWDWQKNEYVPGNPGTPYLSVGQTLDVLGPTSFTASEDMTERLVTGRQQMGDIKPAAGTAGLIFQVDGAQALNVSGVSPYRQAEYLTNGQFTVTAITRDYAEAKTDIYRSRLDTIPVFKVTLKQEGTWQPPAS